MLSPFCPWEFGSLQQRPGTRCLFHKSIVGLIYQLNTRLGGPIAECSAANSPSQQEKMHCMDKMNCLHTGFFGQEAVPLLGGTAFGFMRLGIFFSADNFFNKVQ